MELRETAAIVTGGASGLGGATARMLAQNGATVTILDMNAEQGEKTAAEIGGYFVATDVADDSSMADALAKAEERHGVARLLVNCAGIAPAMRVVNKEGVPHPLDLYRKTVEVNLVGTFNALS